MYYVVFRDDDKRLAVANKMFEHYSDAARYAQTVAVSRQVRICKMIDFRCPKNGEWMNKHAEEFQT